MSRRHIAFRSVFSFLCTYSVKCTVLYTLRAWVSTVCTEKGECTYVRNTVHRSENWNERSIGYHERPRRRLVVSVFVCVRQVKAIIVYVRNTQTDLFNATFQLKLVVLQQSKEWKRVCLFQSQCKRAIILN